MICCGLIAVEMEGVKPHVTPVNGNNDTDLQMTPHLNG